MTCINNCGKRCCEENEPVEIEEYCKRCSEIIFIYKICGECKCIFNGEVLRRSMQICIGTGPCMYFCSDGCAYNINSINQWQVSYQDCNNRAVSVRFERINEQWPYNKPTSQSANKSRTGYLPSAYSAPSKGTTDAGCALTVYNRWIGTITKTGKSKSPCRTESCCFASHAMNRQCTFTIKARVGS